MRIYYIREANGTIRTTSDLLEWAQWFENSDNRHIDKTEFDDGNRVSTVFLGLDHNFCSEGEPILFETMVFGGPFDGQVSRYCTEDQARAGHAEVVHSIISNLGVLPIGKNDQR